jgi:hypothetical protein
VFTPLGGVTKRKHAGQQWWRLVYEMPSRDLQMDASESPYSETRYEDVMKTMGQFFKNLGFQAAKVGCPQGFRCWP